MSTQCSRDGAAGRGDGGLPDAVPVSLERTTRLSWELGERVTRTGEAALRGRWQCVTAPWELAVFDVADHTAVVRVRTPVGRELFYETEAGGLESALPALAEAPDWEPRD
ncbi:hypothetical protein [Halosimplex salinum]|uniref:hypothetical protein n=1 Tax=Halosimplex salinum TaxID=1710538 RepID=UPI000F4A9925|nr:hypothetical protein [Halosimplex salinum]